MKKTKIGTLLLMGAVMNIVLSGNAFAQNQEKSEDKKISAFSIEFSDDGENGFVVSSAPEKEIRKEKVEKTPDNQKVSDSKKEKTRKKVTAKKKATITTYVAYQKAHARVSTKCFPPRLNQVLARVQKRYGVKPIVNSGFRSASYNRRVGGARKSYHVKCMAADIKVPGIGKYVLARYLKTIPGVGGVGTYGCKAFVHVDIGPKRNWHWRCRKRGRKA